MPSKVTRYCLCGEEDTFGDRMTALLRVDAERGRCNELRVAPVECAERGIALTDRAIEAARKRPGSGREATTAVRGEAVLAEGDSPIALRGR